MKVTSITMVKVFNRIASVFGSLNDKRIIRVAAGNDQLDQPKPILDTIYVRYIQGGGNGLIVRPWLHKLPRTQLKVNLPTFFNTLSNSDRHGSLAHQVSRSQGIAALS